LKKYACHDVEKQIVWLPKSGAKIEVSRNVTLVPWYLLIIFIISLYFDIILSTSSSFSDFNEMYFLFFDVRLQDTSLLYQKLE
jgi:hypothetical protein